MPAIVYNGKTNWADDVDEETGGQLPAPTEVQDKDLKIFTEYKLNEDDKKVKVVRTYKIEKRIVSKSIAERKNWAKFGDSKDDRPGPSPATTIIAEDVFMQFLSAKEEENKTDEDIFDKLRSIGDKNVKCRTCSGDHWTSKCPYKDTIFGGGKLIEEKKSFLNPVVPNAVDTAKPGGSKYVPPSMRDGGNKRGESMQMQRRDDTTAIRMSNLSENTTDYDLEELVKPFGFVQKIFLAKEKNTDLFKGFAYVHFRHRHEAAAAIKILNGRGYDHLILNVDWSKPQTQNNQ